AHTRPRRRRRTCRRAATRRAGRRSCGSRYRGASLLLEQPLQPLQHLRIALGLVDEVRDRRLTEVAYDAADREAGRIGGHRLVEVAPSLLAAAQNPLLGEPVHDRHHGGVSEPRRASLVEAVDQVPDADGFASGPRRPNDLGLERSEQLVEVVAALRHDSPDSTTLASYL